MEFKKGDQVIVNGRFSGIIVRATPERDMYVVQYRHPSENKLVKIMYRGAELDLMAPPRPNPDDFKDGFYLMLVHDPNARDPEGQIAVGRDPFNQFFEEELIGFLGPFPFQNSAVFLKNEIEAALRKTNGWADKRPVGVPYLKADGGEEGVINIRPVPLDKDQVEFEIKEWYDLLGIDHPDEFTAFGAFPPYAYFTKNMYRLKMLDGVQTYAGLDLEEKIRDAQEVYAEFYGWRVVASFWGDKRTFFTYDPSEEKFDLTQRHGHWLGGDIEPITSYGTVRDIVGTLLRDEDVYKVKIVEVATLPEEFVPGWYLPVFYKSEEIHPHWQLGGMLGPFSDRSVERRLVEGYKATLSGGNYLSIPTFRSPTVGFKDSPGKYKWENLTLKFHIGTPLLGTEIADRFTESEVFSLLGKGVMPPRWLVEEPPMKPVLYHDEVPESGKLTGWVRTFLGYFKDTELAFFFGTYFFQNTRHRNVLLKRPYGPNDPPTGDEWGSQWVHEAYIDKQTRGDLAFQSELLLNTVLNDPRKSTYQGFSIYQLIASNIEKIVRREKKEEEQEELEHSSHSPFLTGAVVDEMLAEQIERGKWDRYFGMSKTGLPAGRTEKDILRDLRGEDYFKKLRGNPSTIPRGQCYPFAFQLSLDWVKSHEVDDPGVDDLSLFKVVHGRITNRWNGEKNIHAWVETGGRAFDWQSAQEGAPLDIFYEEYQPEPWEEYSAYEVLKNCVREGNYGPWGEKSLEELKLRGNPSLHRLPPGYSKVCFRKLSPIDFQVIFQNKIIGHLREDPTGQGWESIDGQVYPTFLEAKAAAHQIEIASKPQKGKVFIYESFGETLEFAEELGWDDTHTDHSDPNYTPEMADAIEEEALEYIKSKGYSILENNPSEKIPYYSFWHHDSPLKYARSANVQRIALCDGRVKEAPSKRDMYFGEYEEWRHHSKKGYKRLKKPILEEVIPGVKDNCIIGFLDFSTRGDTGDYYELDYLRVRNGHSGKGVSRQLVEELYSSVLKDGDTISWGKMMNEKVSHLLKSMQELYPHIDSFGAEWY